MVSESSYLPRWISSLLPTSAVTFYEDNYACFPYYETRIYNEFFGDRLQYSVKAVVVKGKGDTDNIFDLEYTTLALIQILALTLTLMRVEP